ncbi:hypothetical protein M3P05_13605 [Sansalvadorimonas sp. 2012CJ34-2]|uniref:Uncharacterized protein n=1 Tax=Parendozoicomonas callyspongiae TaxID=2942213 RepID=A0ABT0PI83_9GAMM|nr:hypothetical protein [Sansalvadorimonas sp. 2012CJ34-2]MCL6270961.1 hypothetical protein [Sansalvadorimonas sp. 2012CJ34-2]
MSSSQVLLAHFPEKFHSLSCSHARIYVGVVEKEQEGMYQIGWAMYFYEDEEHTKPGEPAVETDEADLSLSPDELNAVLDAYQQLPSIYGDDDISCNYKLIVAH